MEHVIKLVLYSDVRPNDVSGWKHTIANWIHRADNITVKPRSRKLTKKDLMDSLFSSMGDEVKDYRFALDAFLADNITGKLNHDGKEAYPQIESTPELSEELMDACYSIMMLTIPMLIDKQDHSLEEYYQAIDSIF